MHVGKRTDERKEQRRRLRKTGKRRDQEGQDPRRTEMA